ncbi:MAG: hypothetical protein V3V98_05260 [Thermoplasmata archaeon]
MEDRGVILLGPDEEFLKDPIVVQTLLLVLMSTGLLLPLFLLIRSVQGHASILGSNVLATVTWVMVILLWLWVMNFSVSLETDRIYQNGLTNRNVTLQQRLRGESYQPFDKIDRIGIGKVMIGRFADDAEFLVPFDKEKDQMLRPFVSTDLDGDFYSAVKRTLEERCPEVKWTQVFYKNLKRR